MLGSLVLAGIGCALMSNPRRKRKVRRRNPGKKAHRRRSGVSPGGAASRLAHWRWHHNPRRRGKRRNPSTEVRELELYIINDSDLYRQNVQPVIKNLAKKMAKGIYDKTKAIKLWTYT